MDFTTRSGVFNRPSRSGSSPSLRSTSPYSSSVVTCSKLFAIPVSFLDANLKHHAVTWFPRQQIERVIGCLFHAHTYQANAQGSSALLQHLLYFDRKVLRGGHQISGEERIHVEVRLVEALHDLRIHERVQCHHVNHHARRRVHGSCHSDLQNIVVPVTEGVIALAKRSVVLRFAHGAHVETMRGRETVSPGKMYNRRHALSP